MTILRNRISRGELGKIAEQSLGDLVKAVVDVKRKIMAVGGELHSDEESLLLDDGSRQEDLWGINIYPSLGGNDMIEFDSMINVRPSYGNRSRGVESEKVRKEITDVVNLLVMG